MKRLLLIAPLLLAACASSPATGTSTTAAAPLGTEGQEIRYESEGVALTGYLARPAVRTSSAPGILVVHEWWGHNDYVRKRADQLAELGYVAFAVDMYGSGKLATHPSDATGFMNEVMGNADVMEARFRAGLAVLNSQAGVDAERTGAIGYCMGGGIVLKMARGTDAIDAVASFHGSVGAALGVEDSGRLSHVLIATGGADPFVPKEVVAELTRELRATQDKGGALKSVQIATYPGVLHGFTNPAGTALGEQFDLPLRYDAEADGRSWESLKALFADAF